MPYKDKSAATERRKAWGKERAGSPCNQCGALDRYPSGNCKPCSLETNRKYAAKNPAYFKRRQVSRYYKVPGDTKEKLYAEQQGKCAFCNESLPEVWDRKCHVDHDHVTGKVRGIVHARCNTIIGVLENEEHKERLRKYLNGQG